MSQNPLEVRVLDENGERNFLLTRVDSKEVSIMLTAGCTESLLSTRSILSQRERYLIPVPRSRIHKTRLVKLLVRNFLHRTTE